MTLMDRSPRKEMACESAAVTYGKCKPHGNQLELYAAVTNITVYRAAVDSCHALGCDVPWIKRW